MLFQMKCVWGLYNTFINALGSVINKPKSSFIILLLLDVDALKVGGQRVGVLEQISAEKKRQTGSKDENERAKLLSSRGRRRRKN